MNIYSPVISGSLTVTGSTNFLGNVVMSGSLTFLSGSLTGTASNSDLLSGTGSVGFTTTGSFATMSGSVSSRVSQIETVYATTGSNSFRATQSITGSLTVTGQIIAQTLNVQQVTSSIVYSSGSNVFGCDINSRQTFTGSFYQTGSSMNINAGCVIIGNTTSPASDFFFNVTTVCAGTNATVAQFYNAEYTSGTRGFIRIRNSANIGATTSAYIGQGQDSKTYIYNNDPSRAGDIVINASGLIGMNTCAPIAQLHVKTSVLSGNRPTNLATSATNSAVYFTTIDGSNAGTAFGQISSNTNYIQGTYQDGSSSTPFAINPFGGFVGIGMGTTNPSYVLDVSGSAARVKNAGGSADFILDRGSTSAGATYQYTTAGTLKWYTGLRGLANDNFYLFNNSIGSNALVVDGSSIATFSCTVCAANLIAKTNQNADTTMAVYNQTDGTASSVTVRLDNGSYAGLINLYANSYTTSGTATANAMRIYTDGPGGMNFSATNQHIRFYTSPNECLRMAILYGGAVGIGNSNPKHNFDVNNVTTNAGGLAFCNILAPQGAWCTFACVGSDSNVVTTITYTNTGDYNRSGVFVARWAYNNACAALHIVSCLWSNAQNVSMDLRNNSGALQICTSGGGGDYRVQALIQGAKAT